MASVSAAGPEGAAGGAADPGAAAAAAEPAEEHAGKRVQAEEHAGKRVQAAERRESAKRARTEAADDLVTVVVPCHNAEPYLPDALGSVLAQSHRPLELSIVDDGSTDASRAVIETWAPRLERAGVRVVLTCVPPGQNGGAGAARNRAVAAGAGQWLCFLDADDLMAPQRVERQLAAARAAPAGALVGSQFTRLPAGSTPAYADWCNALSPEQLVLEQYRELTLILPTWFMSRAAFEAAGRFDEVRPVKGAYHPEDLHLFHRHLEAGGALRRVDEALVTYRYTEGSACSNTPRRVLMRARIPYLARRVLAGWPRFAIWGAGRDGKQFLNDLPAEAAAKVTQFCDVDPKKIGRDYVFRKAGNRHIPVVHFSDVQPPVVICVASKTRGGALQANIESLGLEEGVDYVRFS